MRTSSSLLVVLLAIGAATGSFTNLAKEPCGKQSAKTRVVGGGQARPGQFPWLVSVQLDNQPWCGGSLVNKDFVVTAAHCIKTRPVSDFSVVTGEHDLKTKSAYEKRIPVQAAALHPGYKVGKYSHDLAVLRLASPATFGPRVQPVCLPPAAGWAPAGRTGTVAGWGWLDEPNNGGERSNILQMVDVPIMGPAQCTGWFADAGRKNKLRDGQLCAGFKEGGKDGCQGDSGGPLLLTEGGRVTLAGVVSAGVGCARPSLPGVYTDVAKYMSWITEMVQ